MLVEFRNLPLFIEVNHFSSQLVQSWIEVFVLLVRTFLSYDFITTELKTISSPPLSTGIVPLPSNMTFHLKRHYDKDQIVNKEWRDTIHKSILCVDTSTFLLPLLPQYL